VPLNLKRSDIRKIRGRKLFDFGRHPGTFVLETARGMIEMSRQYRPTQVRRSMSYGAWTSEFCVVRLAGKRRCGHTTAALHLLAENPESVYLCPSNKHLDSAVERALRMKFVAPASTILACTSDELRGLSHRVLDLVIVDPASYTEDFALQSIIVRFGPVLSPRGVILFLG